MTLTIALIGASVFVLSEILKNRGYSQLSKALFPITSGISLITLLWWITKKVF